MIMTTIFFIRWLVRFCLVFDIRSTNLQITLGRLPSRPIMLTVNHMAEGSVSVFKYL